MTAYQQLLAEHPDDARLHLEHGYLQECRGRNLIRTAVGCYERAIEAAAEWRCIISWLEAHNDTLHTTWPKEMLEGIEAKLAAADADAEGAGD